MIRDNLETSERAAPCSDYKLIKYQEQMDYSRTGQAMLSSFVTRQPRALRQTSVQSNKDYLVSEPQDSAQITH